MAKDKNVLDESIDLTLPVEFIRSNGEEVSKELATNLSNFLFDIYEGEKYDEEKTNYHGSLGNFIAEK